MNAVTADELVVDVLVAGAGAAGLATAITARKLGLEVLVVEKDGFFGGTTALSGGWLWIPCSPLAQRAGVNDSIDAARTYLRHECGKGYDARKVDAYLSSGPDMVSFFERETKLQFMLDISYPDYHPTSPGGTTGGRAICALPFDGLQLGALLPALLPPVRELTLFGLKVGSGPDFKHFFNVRRSLRSALYVAGRMVRHATDVARHGRDVLLMNGNALVGRLAASSFAMGIPMWLVSPLQALRTDVEGRVTGAVVWHEGRATTVHARRGVVLATGGFAQDEARRRAVYPHHPQRDGHFSLAARGNIGDGLRLVESLGGGLDPVTSQPGAWMPMSRIPRAGREASTYPHSFDRGKPGAILVDAHGKRFVNESDSYHDTVTALLQNAYAKQMPTAAWIIADSEFVRRYGLGYARPFPFPHGRLIRSGYLKRAATPRALAASIGVPADELARTLDVFNRAAREGRDPQFHRGENAYNRHQGDPDRRQFACVAPIETAPYYAVRIYPGDLGTFAGIRTDENAQVRGHDDRLIAGLYAVGCDAANLFGGAYPGPGSNLGPALTFGYRCALHIAGASAEQRPPGAGLPASGDS